MWFVYIIECRDETLYTGITTDVRRRIEEHNASEKGAKYTRGKRPVTLVYHKRCADRSAAAKEEYRIKQLSREEKQMLISKMDTE
jgi:putative endonuclease